VFNRLVLMLALMLAFVTAGCVTVRPQERAILADPLMRFDDTAAQDAQLEHVLDNREGSFGGGTVQGGGCGCN
jgi:hypothetical protein